MKESFAGKKDNKKGVVLLQAIDIPESNQLHYNPVTSQTQGN